jgi:hypothetical protein
MCNAEWEGWGYSDCGWCPDAPCWDIEGALTADESPQTEEEDWDPTQVKNPPGL